MEGKRVKNKKRQTKGRDDETGDVKCGVKGVM